MVATATPPSTSPVSEARRSIFIDREAPAFSQGRLHLAYARAAGNPAPIETLIYPGAYHAWTVPGLATLRFYPDYVSTKKCPLILLGPKRSMFFIDGETEPFDPSSLGACLGEARGYSMA